LAINGKRTPDSFHRELGKLMWDKCGMARNRNGLQEALQRIPEIRDEFWKNLSVSGTNESFNQSLERAGRVADFLGFAEIMCLDALEREESCGGHFREEHQTEDGEAKRDDQKFCNAAVWEFQGEGKRPVKHVEDLKFENIQLATRSYK
jgi:succinate dehydrogenase / fumarate reductase flavoprotein subunit